MKSEYLLHDDQGLFEDRIVSLAERYQEKFGVKPVVCLVHPGDFDALLLELEERLEPEQKNAPSEIIVAGIHISAKYTVSRNYFWFGLEDERITEIKTSVQVRDFGSFLLFGSDDE